MDYFRIFRCMAISLSCRKALSTTVPWELDAVVMIIPHCNVNCRHFQCRRSRLPARSLNVEWRHWERVQSPIGCSMYNDSALNVSQSNKSNLIAESKVDRFHCSLYFWVDSRDIFVQDQENINRCDSSGNKALVDVVMRWCEIVIVISIFRVFRV